MPTMLEPTRRLMQFMDYAVEHKLNGVTGQQNFLSAIGFSPNNISGLRAGRHNFTVEQLQTASELFSIDMNWLFGHSKKMLRTTARQSPIEELREAVRRVEAELEKRGKK